MIGGSDAVAFAVFDIDDRTEVSRGIGDALSRVGFRAVVAKEFVVQGNAPDAVSKSDASLVQ